MTLTRWNTVPMMLVIAMTSVFLLGCNEKKNADTKVSGVVIDGPVIAGDVMALNKDGIVIGETTIGQDAVYGFTARAKGREFPLILRVENGTNLVTGTAPEFPLEAVIVSPGASSVLNITPFSTLVTQVSSRLPGGHTNENLSTATTIVADNLGFGLSLGGNDNPSITAINKDNIATFTRSSEALTESIRRSRDALMVSGSNLSANDIVESIAADLIDGKLDGRGAGKADPKVSAATSVAAAQVLIETMTDGLKVNKVRATDAMDMAVQQVMSGDTTIPSTAELPIPKKMLVQAEKSVGLARALDNNPTLDTLANRLSGLREGLNPQEIEAMLPVGSDIALADALNATVMSSETEIRTALDSTSGGEPAPEPTPEPEPNPEPEPQNTAPVISGQPSNQADVGTVYRFQASASDSDGDSLRFLIANKPNWATFNTSNGTLSGTPSTAGEFTGIRISVTDEEATASLPSFSITVNPAPPPPPEPNNAPSISGSPATQVSAGQNYSFRPNAQDADGDDLVFSIANKPNWASFTASNGRLSGTPTNADAGDYANIVISVSDDETSASLAAFTLTVESVVEPPVEPPVTQILLHYDGDTNDKHDIASLPVAALLIDKAELNAVTTIAYNNNILGGSNSSQINAMRNSAAFAASLGINTVDYEAGTTAAVASIAAIFNSGNPVIAIEGGPMEAVYRALSQTDTDKLGNITLISHSDSNEQYASNGTHTWADLQAAYPAVSFVDIKDQNAGFNSEDWEWLDRAVDPVNQAARAAMLNADEKLNDASDAGMVYWYLTSNDGGTPADAQNYLGAEVTPPVVTPTASFEFSYNAGFTNPQSLDGATLTNPAYLFVNPGNEIDSVTFSNGRTEGAAPFEWMPFANGQSQTADFANGSYTVSAVVTFNGGETTTIDASFVVDQDIVEPPPPENQAPVISGSPAGQITAGTAYSFTPTASDPDGGSLSFTVSGLPSWASFNNTTGRLSGSPSVNDVGSYGDIVITVSDGQDSTSLPAFSIQVVGTATASLTASWQPPTSNADGSTLTDLAGYKLYYGTQSGVYPNVVDIDNAGITTYVVDGLSPGTYYFTITAVDNAGNESAFASEASRGIP